MNNDLANMNYPSLPAEWTPQESTFVVLPHAKTEWVADLDLITQDYLILIRTIARFQPVTILCADETLATNLQAKLKLDHNFNRMRCIEIPTQDIWIRDFGPISVYTPSGERVCLNFQFNAWGDKYPATLDNQVNAALVEHNILPAVHDIDWVLEGGALETDGEGTLLTTTSCLLNPNRNGSLSQEEVERKLEQYLGIKKVIWIEHSELIGDDTDGHIDMLVRFSESGALLYTHCIDPSDPQFASLNALELELQSKCADYERIPLPIPAPIITAQGERLPASYANFLVINDAVLIPAYDAPHDQLAYDRIQRAFPNRELMQIPCKRLIEQFGSLHCATMQLPLPMRRTPS